MRLIGLEDEGFGDMGDFTGKVIIPLDFNTVVPLLQKKPIDSFSICTNTFEELFSYLKKELGNDADCDVLVLMRVKKEFATKKYATEYGRKISSLLTEDNIVTWAAQSYDKYRFDFYIY